MKTFYSQFKSALFFSLMSFSFLKAQTTFQWAKQMGGGMQDRGYAIASDALGNIYTTGFFQGIADFDPGPGTFTMSSSGFSDNEVFISKVDFSGNLVWAKKIGGLNGDYGRSIVVDGSGNVLITGSFQGLVDFDPGSGIFNLTSAGNNDVFILKLDPAGNFVWAKNVGGTGDDNGHDIAVDATNNLVVTGYFSSIADFDPAASTYTMSAFGGNYSAYILKLDNSGNLIWAKQFNGVANNPNIMGNSIVLDAAGNVFSGGTFSGNVDFDPGAGTFIINATNADVYVSKLDPSGNFVWAKNIGGVGVSGSGNSIALDPSNNVYTTGYFDQTVDFDPGVGTFSITSSGMLDIYILKLDATGNFVWAKTMGGALSDQGHGITIGPGGYVYTTGQFSGVADFDPSAGTYTLAVLGMSSGVFISKLDPSGNFIWANGIGNINNGGANAGYGIVVNPVFDVYTTGVFNTVIDFDPGVGTYTLIPSGNGGNDEIFVHKLGQPGCPTFSINSTTNSYTLMCALNTLTLNAINTSTYSGITYTWTAPSSVTATGTSYTVTTPGVYTVAASAPANTCMVTQIVSIVQTTGNVNYTINTTGSTCNNNGSATLNIGSGAAPFTYTWSTTNTASVVTGLAPGNYSVTVTDANQCTNTQTFSISNDALTFSSVPICFVTVDSLSQHNVIVWDKTLFPTADTFYVYRETGTNVYQLIQKQPYSALSKFVDTVKTLYFPNTGNPNVGTYRYKMKTKDNCNNMSNFTPYHNTLFMVNNNGTFSWTQLYQIEGDPNPVLAYILERDDMSNGNWGAIGSVAGTQQFVIDPNYSNFVNTASWRVKTQWNINCTPSKSSSPANSSSYSNRVTNNNVGLKKESINNLISIYPNPSNGIIQISSKIKMSQFEVTNALGVKIYSGEGDISIIDLSKEANGIYFIKLTVNNQTMVKKVVITK